MHFYHRLLKLGLFVAKGWLQINRFLFNDVKDLDEASTDQFDACLDQIVLLFVNLKLFFNIKSVRWHIRTAISLTRHTSTVTSPNLVAS